ncbi:GATA transcription factor 11 isoform X2 [Abrus precatorius]|nr:GATA transcription factor 11 isoform X2 [Abrus precatorius]XP_027345947.1 GATA transcription factor 11 isoform X2 [Abrus precatorius]XP_027345948.1 GATA transcription factor 11 isoform X2 [Abrus precatorius]XP_027345949.1 GATA transcription factor 11 isoform X2 [Abrus precatorius]XP_027345950.1 GATA transcription factor 11 isoform X2 [Abrus precatorius]
MKNCWVFDNNLNGLSDEILDDVIEFFDFPLEDVEIDGVEQDWDDQFKLEEPSLRVFSVSSSELSVQTLNENAKHECSFSASLAKTAGPTCGKTIPIQNVSFDRKELHQCQTYSPVSVFEGGSASSVVNSTLELPFILAKRPRGKRQRPSNSSPLFSIPFSSTLPSFQKSPRIDDSELEIQPTGKLLSSVNKKQREEDISLLTSKTETKRSSSQESVAPRKCMHCEMTKTPQWREGPMGPKTLCNACGVRYRSGRLFPEYRPAASPTFVASLHSNSHKVVLEMRNKATQVSVRCSSLLSRSSNLPGNSLG